MPLEALAPVPSAALLHVPHFTALLLRHGVRLGTAAVGGMAAPALG